MMPALLRCTAGTIGVSIGLASLGVDYLRVHDVLAVRDALVAWKTVTEGMREQD